jgi:D-alanine-D-alanine ligase
MKRLRVLVLVHPDLLPPESSKGYSEQEINEWKTEYDVVKTLRRAGHEVRPLGVHDELKPIRDEIDSWKQDVVLTLLEEFHGEAIYDQNVASFLELMHVPYTGCNPRGLMLARGKDLSKTLVHYHRIPVPAFAVFPMRRKVRRPARLALPLIVKSLNEDGSYGISQASVVDSDAKLAERVGFIHERIGTPAIAEQYIDGARSMSACWAMSGCGCCRFGSWSSATWRKATGRSLPRRPSTIRIIRSAAKSCMARRKILRLKSSPAFSA